MADVTYILFVLGSAVELTWSFPSGSSSIYTNPLVAMEVPSEEFNTDGQGLGTVAAVDVDSQGNLWAFHRGDRPLFEETFGTYYGRNLINDEDYIPIDQDLIVKLDPDTGKIISSFGANMFNVPHGLKFDRDDNLWVTDIARHQILRFPNGSTTPDLVLGEKFVPGDDDVHFCKPTDVAVAENGEIFVSDGYCNTRVVKFSKDGEFMAAWGGPVGSDGSLTPYQFDIPHSITVVDELDLVCVADRENERIQCFNAGLGSGRRLGFYNRTLAAGVIGRVYVIQYNKASGNLVASAATSRLPYSNGVSTIFPPRGFIFTMDDHVVGTWGYITPDMAAKGESIIHGMCVSNDGRDFYMADVMQSKVHKYSSRPRQ